VLLSRLDKLVQAQNTLFSKDRLHRRTAPLQIDPKTFSNDDYEGIAATLAPYERLLEHVPASRGGLRWRHVDGAVVFGGEHVFAIAYDKFVRRVDIARAIQYMNDYIGGDTVAVRRDGRGRVVQQAERNLYLQQPNWIVLFGGEVIDVEKIEYIRYERGRRTIHWRTVASPNGSATVDDGCVSFSRTGDGQTHVRVFARQRFRLPLTFQLFDIDLAPAVRDPIIEGAYATYFSGTMANLQAAYAGKDFRIGQDHGAAAPKRTLPRFLATAAAALAELLRRRDGAGQLGDVAAWLLATQPTVAPASSASAAPAIDANGFRHFAPAETASESEASSDRLVAGMAALARDAPDFLQGLADAVHHDLDRLAASAGGE
jgi:hypothetical protein